jgi:two-component system, cell cycle sensor histidine kinase and response regulator CckA
VGEFSQGEALDGVRETPESGVDPLHTERLAQIGRLAAGIVHELNQPATFVIVSHANLGNLLGELERELRELPGPAAARSRELAAQAARIAADATAEMQRLRQLARSVRDYARPGQGSVAGVEINELVSTACAVARHELGACVSVTRRLGARSHVTCDPVTLIQVMINLVVNAADAIAGRADGERGLRITTRDDGDHVELEVDDDGTGIAPEIADRIFEPFFTTKRDHGSGLGLWLCASIVRGLGGRIHFESEPGAGTRFVVRLPRSPSDH